MHSKATAGDAFGGTETTHHIPWLEPLGRTQCSGSTAAKIQSTVRSLKAGLNFFPQPENNEAREETKRLINENEDEEWREQIARTKWQT